MFHKCKNISFQDSTYLDSPCWTFWLMMCENIQVNRLKIVTDYKLINADGIDVDSCRNVTISDCIMDTQDDCLVFRAMQPVHEEEAVCENITVSNCVLRSDRQSVRISCPNDNIVRNITLNNITMNGANGVYFHFPSRFYDSSLGVTAQVTNISFSNIVMNCEKYPVNFEIQDGVNVKEISDISFSNTRITSGLPFNIQGNKDSIIKNITLTDTTIKSSAESALQTSHCTGIKLNNVELSAQKR
jgi:polygalacturonase